MNLSEKFKAQLEAIRNRPKEQFVAWEYEGSSSTGRRFFFEATSAEQAAEQCKKQLLSEGKPATLYVNAHAVRVKNFSYIITKVVVKGEDE
jgi:hypothetical protein